MLDDSRRIDCGRRVSGPDGRCPLGPGFTVYEASNADEAIRILETHHDIRVVFTDINMPGSMDGLKPAHYVRGRWPPIKLIITLGHPVTLHEIWV